MDIHLYLHSDSEISKTLAEIKTALQTLLTRSEQMAGELDTLKAAVAANTTVIGSAVTLIQGLKSSLDAAIAQLPDPAALQALSDELGAQDSALAAAVAAGTPATP